MIRTPNVTLGQGSELKEAANCYCPHCGYGPLDGCTHCEIDEKNSSETEDGQHKHGNILPKDGDISLCIRCGNFCAYVVEDQNVSIALPSKELYESWQEDPRNWLGILKTQRAVKTVSLEKMDGDKYVRIPQRFKDD